MLDLAAAGRIYIISRYVQFNRSTCGKMESASLVGNKASISIHVGRKYMCINNAISTLEDMFGFRYPSALIVASTLRNH